MFDADGQFAQTLARRVEHGIALAGVRPSSAPLRPGAIEARIDLARLAQRNLPDHAAAGLCSRECGSSPALSVAPTTRSHADGPLSTPRALRHRGGASSPPSGSPRASVRLNHPTRSPNRLGSAMQASSGTRMTDAVPQDRLVREELRGERNKMRPGRRSLSSRESRE